MEHDSRAKQARPEDRGGRERRRWTRTNADLPITLFLPSGRFQARVRDVSRAGVCFFLDRPLPLMTVLQMTLALRVPGGVRHVTGCGAVVRCERISKALDHWEIALFLHELSEHDRELIEEFVREQELARGETPRAGAAERSAGE